MIPPDVASRLQATADVALRPVAPTQEITDKLSDLVVGQRVMAEVQALLPNGTYRALINQRNITLALPFSARSGDTLELEVTESDGKLALAVVAHQEGDAKATREAVSATLSRTGQLIGRLFSRNGKTENDAKALPLNGNRPIAGTPPGSAQELLPLLKEAIARSGMFYESHQAEWVEGRFAKSELLQEPQGKLSTPAAFAAETNPAESPATAQARASATTVSNRPAQASGQPANEPASAARTAEASRAQSSGQIVAPQVQTVVHHQLEALANQAFVWQGQIWPGQDMRWEIEEDGRNRQEEGDATAGNWRTRLDLAFPGLGGVCARLHLHDGQVSLAITVDNDASLGVLQTGTDALRQQFGDAGLALSSLGITAQSGQ